MGQAVSTVSESAYRQRLRELSRTLWVEKESHIETAERLEMAEQRAAELRRELEQVRQQKLARGPVVEARQVIMSVAARCGFSYDELTGRRGSKALVQARHLAACEVRRLCPALSCVDVGRLFNRHHSSILHAWKKDVSQ